MSLTEYLFFCEARVEVVNTPALLFCFSTTSEPNPYHVRLPSRSNYLGFELKDRACQRLS